MIYEYALDPALVATWHDRKEYLFFDEKFGVSTRRLVSIYPKKTKWQSMIWEAFQSSSDGVDESAKMRLSALIGKLAENAVRRKSTFPEIPIWLDRTLAEHEKRPFRAILTNSNNNSPDVIQAGKLIAKDHEKWLIPDLPTVPRRAREIAKALSPVLRVAKNIIFIDPYFNPEKLRFSNPLQLMLNSIYQYRDFTDEVGIELHTGIDHFFNRPDSPIRTPANEEQKFRELGQLFSEKVSAITPKGVKITLTIWKERINGQEFHNRYVLTEFMGVLFATGLDECSNQNANSSDILSCLTNAQRTDCWRQYERSNPAFDYAGKPIEIIGQRI